jgi:hypothetical protein
MFIQKPNLFIKRTFLKNYFYQESKDYQAIEKKLNFKLFNEKRIQKENFYKIKPFSIISKKKIFRCFITNLNPIWNINKNNIEKIFILNKIDRFRQKFLNYFCTFFITNIKKQFKYFQFLNYELKEKNNNNKFKRINDINKFILLKNIKNNYIHYFLYSLVKLWIFKFYFIKIFHTYNNKNKPKLKFLSIFVKFNIFIIKKNKKLIYKNKLQYKY